MEGLDTPLFARTPSSPGQRGNSDVVADHGPPLPFSRWILARKNHSRGEVTE